MYFSSNGNSFEAQIGATVYYVCLQSFPLATQPLAAVSCPFNMCARVEICRRGSVRIVRVVFAETDKQISPLNVEIRVQNTTRSPSLPLQPVSLCNISNMY